MSSTGALSTMAGIAEFLDSEVATMVPTHIRGEVRAAAKLLRSASTELAVRHREVDAEIEDLVALCAEAALDSELAELAALRARWRVRGMSLSEQDDLRVAVHEMAARTMVRLVEVDDPLLRRFLRCFGEHAARRSTWQAVFPVHAAGGSA